jgi:hypothetical protein
MEYGNWRTCFEMKPAGWLSSGDTTVAPETPYDAWDGVQWVTNEAAKIAADVKNAELKRQSNLLWQGQ